MTSVSVIRTLEDAYVYAEDDSEVVHPKMTIVAEDGTAFTVPYAPRETTLDGWAPTFATADRGGRQPLLLRSGQGLPQITFDLTFGAPDPQVSIERQLAALRTLARSGKRMRVNLDPTTTQFLWRLTGFSQQVMSRQHGTNHATRAVCSLTFQRAVDAVVAVGPVSGGKKGSGGNKKIPRYHVWRKGDTLVKLAVQYYDEASMWRRIADVNGIRRPKHIAVGRRLLLPLVKR